MNQFRLVQAIDRFSQCIVVAVAPAADRWLDARLGQPFAVANADVLGVFNRSSQHEIVEQILDARSMLLPESSIQASFEA